MKQNAFSLVELSIVLVILGLLVGGILAGQSLIRAAELRSVNSDYSRYVTATHAFRDKYFAMPGDMATATSFWGSLGGTGADTTCMDIVATGAATCNGNGDNFLESGVADTATSIQESFHFWQHLSNAGLIEGRYNGRGAGSGVPGSELPTTKLTSTGRWGAMSNSQPMANSNRHFSSDRGNFFALDTTTGQASYPLNPEEAWNIDTKIDDGRPGYGKIISNKGNNASYNCTDATAAVPPADANAMYLLSNTKKECMFFFVRAF